MIKCPMCSASNDDDARKCRRCQADLALLADYVSHLVDGLSQAESLTRAGELGEAVWAYLAVLEIDPDNATARRQVGKVVTAVRQFDETAPGRRWLTSIQKQSWWRRWLAGEEGEGSGILVWTLGFILLLGTVFFSYSWGYNAGRNEAQPMRSVDDEEAFQKEQKLKREEDEKKKKAAQEKKEKKEPQLGKP
jgi:hypothetical protein